MSKNVEDFSTAIELRRQWISISRTVASCYYRREQPKPEDLTALRNLTDDLIDLARKNSEPKCRNCGRQLVPGTKRSWLHRIQDFDPTKPIDCYEPEGT